MKRLLLPAILLSLCVSEPAFATFTVYSPNVRKGMVELEGKARYDIDDNNSVDGYRKYLFEANYGVTEWWKAGAEFVRERTPQGEDKYSVTELTSTFEFAEPGEYFFHPGMRVVYEMAHGYQAADEVEALLLLNRQQGDFTHTINFAFGHEVGSHSEDGLEAGASYRLRYKWLGYINPAFEYYGEFGEVDDIERFSRQEHRAGPVLWGKFDLNDEKNSYLAYEAGYLVGLTPHTEDGSFKFKIEYEFTF